MRGLKDKVAIVAGAARGNIRAATESLALHVALPVELSIALEDRPPPVEVAVHYLICEALTNIAKYARADAGPSGALGGRLRVWNAPATGTRVRAEIPLPLELSTGC